MTSASSVTEPNKTDAAHGGFTRTSIRVLLDEMEMHSTALHTNTRTKALLFEAAQAIVQLAVRVADLEKAAAQPRIILPGS